MTEPLAFELAPALVPPMQLYDATHSKALGIGQEDATVLHQLFHVSMVLRLGACPLGTGLYLASLDGTRKRFPPSRVTIPWRKRCYNFHMASEIDSLQERVDAIRTTGDSELAGRAWHALSAVLFQFTREKIGRVGPNVPIIQRVTVTDVEHFLSDLTDSASGRAR